MCRLRSKRYKVAVEDFSITAADLLFSLARRAVLESSGKVVGVSLH